MRVAACSADEDPAPQHPDVARVVDAALNSA
jgi:hypothetical protein